MMGTHESPRLLKAKDARQLNATVAFNYEDIRRRCEEHIESVRLQARELLETAGREAEALRRNALAEGRRDGLQQGRETAEDEIRTRTAEQAESIAVEKLKTTLPAMHAAVNELVYERERWLAEWEAAAIRLSVAIAEKLLNRELAAHPEGPSEMIRAALELAAGTPHIRVRMHPDDIARLGGYAEDVVKCLASCGQATLVPDESLVPGGCLIETQHGVIDGRLETQLERITNELVQPDP